MDRGGLGGKLGDLERMERIDPLRNGGNRPDSEQRDDLRAPVIRLQKDRFTWEAQRFRRDLRGLAGGGGGGGGYPFRFQKGSEFNESGGGDGLGFHVGF